MPFGWRDAFLFGNWSNMALSYSIVLFNIPWSNISNQNLISQKKSTAELGCARATAGGEKGRHGQLFFAEGSLIYSVMGCRWLCVCVCVMYSEMGLMFVYVCIACVIIPNALLALRPSLDKWWHAFSRGQAPWWGWVYSLVDEHRWIHDILICILWNWFGATSFYTITVLLMRPTLPILVQSVSHSILTGITPPFGLALFNVFLSISTHMCWQIMNVTSCDKTTTVSSQTWQIFDELGKIDADRFWSNMVVGVLLINPIWSR